MQYAVPNCSDSSSSCKLPFCDDLFILSKSKGPFHSCANWYFGGNAILPGGWWRGGFGGCGSQAASQPNYQMVQRSMCFLFFLVSPKQHTTQNGFLDGWTWPGWDKNRFVHPKFGRQVVNEKTLLHEALNGVHVTLAVLETNRHLQEVLLDHRSVQNKTFCGWPAQNKRARSQKRPNEQHEEQQKTTKKQTPNQTNNQQIWEAQKRPVAKIQNQNSRPNCWSPFAVGGTTCQRNCRTIAKFCRETKG